jgi:hypothetical protein
VLSRRVNQPRLLVVILLTLCFLLSGCGGETPEVSQDTSPPSAKEEQADSSTQQPEAESAPFEEAELPKDFPSSFPMPEDTRVASNVATTAENEFRVYLSLTISTEEALAFYLQELPANGWRIDQQEDSLGGPELRFSNPDYMGQMLIVEAETGVGLDVHLYPPESAELPPELAQEFGQSNTLGDTESDFPNDLPLPSGFIPVDLTDQLQADGYQLAFTYGDAAEMAMVELNITLMTAGWEMNDPTIDPKTATYIIPFVNPETGFEGYAYITRDASGAALIALAPGKP